jgi:hypothetical protein
VFPVSKVEKADTWENFPPRTEAFLSGENRVYRERYNDEGPSRYRDAPVSLQLVTRKFHEEEALLIVEETNSIQVAQCISKSALMVRGHKLPNSTLIIS